MLINEMEGGGGILCIVDLYKSRNKVYLRPFKKRHQNIFVFSYRDGYLVRRGVDFFSTPHTVKLCGIKNKTLKRIKPKMYLKIL